MTGDRVAGSGAVRAGVSLAAGLAMLVASSVGAGAQDSRSWPNFASSARDQTYNPAFDRQFVRDWEANPPKGYPTLSKDNLEPTRAAIKRYEAIVKDGGWRPVPDVGKLEVGLTHSAVGILRERLLASGDLREDTGSGDYFDYSLEKAVKRFQASNGLTPTGVVDKRTIPALNVTAQDRLRQLKVNLGRLQALAPSAGKRYVLVNIPAQQIEAVEGDKVVSRHAGVVGKPDRPSPLLRSAVHELNFNPIWHLPPTVITKDLIPKGREMQGRGQNVLTKFGIDAYDGNGRKLDPDKINWSSPTAQGLTFRQQPGKDNPLGFVKINFHNAHSVYLHDTPSDRLFGRNFRAASSGCVRVDNIETLAAWLLEENGWTVEKVAAMRQSGERADVKLKRPVTLHMAYITAWATEDGVVQFRRDLYGRDGIGATASAY